MRLIMQFGAPIDMTSLAALDDPGKSGVRYNDIKDNEFDQKVYVAEFQYKIVDLMDKFEAENKDDIQVSIFSDAVTQQ